MKTRISVTATLRNCAVALILAATAAQAAAHVVIGTVKDIDRAGRTMVVVVADGTESAFHFSEKTVEGIPADVAKGATVVVRSSGEGAEKVAVSVRKVGLKAPRAVDGTVVSVDKKSRSVIVDTGKGAKEVFHVADRGVVDTGEGVERASVASVKAGERVSVHYTDEGGRKVAHVLRRVL
jgi:hypothetical protein